MGVTRGPKIWGYTGGMAHL